MSNDSTELRRILIHRHLQFGWWGLLLFIVLGIVLETLHGFKFGLYLDPANKVRRLLWTLAHAHGTLLALVQIAFAATVAHLPTLAGKRLRLASFLLIDALVVLPLGFFLGGVNPSEGDPGIGVLLVPIGALFLLGAVVLVALATTQPR